jgi:hypothetical protein
MKIPHIQFTVRRLMAVVAVVALVFGIIRLWGLRQLYLKKAADHAGFRAYVLNSRDSVQHWETRWRDQREGRPAKYPWPAGPPFVPAITKYHDDMRIKHERAARHPWLPVAPDPL